MPEYEVKAIVTKEHWQGFFVGLTVGVLAVLAVGILI